MPTKGKKTHSLDDKVLGYLYKLTGLQQLTLQEEFPQDRIYIAFMHPTHMHKARVELNKESIYALKQDSLKIAQYTAALIFNEFPDIAGYDQPVSNAVKITPGTIHSGSIVFQEWKPLPKFQALVSSNTVPVTISADMTKFAAGMNEVSKQMEQMAKVMAAEWAKAFNAFKPSFEQLNELVKESKYKPADYALVHSGMKARHDCPAKARVVDYSTGKVYNSQNLCDHQNWVLDRLIVHLNDSHRWTREQIADWLDTLDSQPVFYPEIEEQEVGA